MALYFKDRIPDPIHGENARYYDAVGDNGTAKLADFKLVLKNNIPIGKEGDPVSADNINFASGNITMPAGMPGIINKGELLALTPDGAVIPAKTKRSVKATGIAYSTARFCGFLRLSNTKLLILYYDRMVVATVNFTNKTVTFGAYFIMSAGMSGSMTLIRSHDENATAIVCGVDGATLRVYNITADVISTAGTLANVTNIAGAEGTSVLALNSVASPMTAKLVDCGGAAPSVTATASFPAQSSIIGSSLNRYGGGGGKYIFFCANQTNGTAHAYPITASGATVTIDPMQNLGNTPDTYHFDTGGNIFKRSDGNSNPLNKVIMFGAEGAGSPLPVYIQIFDVNTSGAITKGAKIKLPIYSSGLTTLTYTSDKIYITGAAVIAGLYDLCLYEITLNGTNIQTIKQYRPFHLLKVDSPASVTFAAYENPVNPGEYLFMEAFGGYSSPLPNLTFRFGYKTDCADPNNIIGIAIENSANGYVRLQTSGKYLPGLLNGLQAGQSYMAGDNGGLLPYAGDEGTKPVGIAAGSKDFQFFGALVI